MYPSEWKGSVDSPSGVATFRIEGLDFAVKLNSFTDYQMLSNMLDLAFKHGNQVAAAAMRSHIMNAMHEAERVHTR